jgi:hypothetical protein
MGDVRAAVASAGTRAGGLGEAIGVIGGVRQKIHFFCMNLRQSHAPFVKAYSARVSAALN